MFQKSRHERLLLFLTLKPIVEDVNTGEISKCKGDTSPGLGEYILLVANKILTIG